MLDHICGQEKEEIRKTMMEMNNQPLHRFPLTNSCFLFSLAHELAGSPRLIRTYSISRLGLGSARD